MEILKSDPSSYCNNCNFKNFYSIDFSDDFKLPNSSCQFARLNRRFLLASGVDSVVYESEDDKYVIKIFPYLRSKHVESYKDEIDRVSLDLTGKRKLLGKEYNLVFIPIDKIVRNVFGNRCLMAVSRNIKFPNFAKYRNDHTDTPDLLIPIEDMFSKYYKKRALATGRKLDRRFDLNDMNFKLDDQTNTIYFTDIASSISVFLDTYLPKSY